MYCIHICNYVYICIAYIYYILLCIQYIYIYINVYNTYILYNMYCILFYICICIHMSYICTYICIVKIIYIYIYNILSADDQPGIWLLSILCMLSGKCVYHPCLAQQHVVTSDASSSHVSVIIQKNVHDKKRWIKD